MVLTVIYYEIPIGYIIIKFSKNCHGIIIISNNKNNNKMYHSITLISVDDYITENIIIYVFISSWLVEKQKI